MLTRTYGNVATPSFPTVALLASVAAYAEATGTGSLRRVSCDDGFQIAFRRSAGGVRWVLATAGREDETRVDAMLMMCERIAEGVCGRDALNCDAGERRGGAQRMKMALGACVAAIDRAMDTRAPPSFAPFGVHGMNRTKTETETERDDDDASARTFVEGLASALPTVDRVAMVATTSGSRRRRRDTREHRRLEILDVRRGWARRTRRPRVRAARSGRQGRAGVRRRRHDPGAAVDGISRERTGGGGDRGRTGADAYGVSRGGETHD